MSARLQQQYRINRWSTIRISYLEGIFILWSIDNYQDCWAIYRTQMDRLFHLEHISKNDEFKEFDDWSIYKQAHANILAKSDKRFPIEQTSKVYYHLDEMTPRIKEILKTKPQWKRPKAEQVAKEMGMDFLYKFGYDLASMHIHPMSNDGQQDFYTITGIEPSVSFPSQISVLHDSILTVTLMTQNIFNYSSFAWRKVLWDFLDQIRGAIDTGADEYKLTYLKIVSYVQSKHPLKQENA